MGQLQEILLDPGFEQMQRQFCNAHCLQFEATEENKLCYMSIFKEYTALVETHIVTRLAQTVAHFNMETFLSQVVAR